VHVDITERKLAEEALSSVEFYLRPWLKLKDATIFDLDESKKKAPRGSARGYIESPICTILQTAFRSL